MDIERERQINALARALLERPESDWVRYLDASAADPELRRDADELARAAACAPADPVLRITVELDDTPPARIGPFRIVRKIGVGGMGTVYAALDPGSDMVVAVKTITRGMNTDECLRRFRAERSILSHLRHKNIVRLLDAGATEDGRPYFVMEYIDGVPITDCVTRHRLSGRERARLFAELCDAVAAAHRSTIVHRDLKPSNVLVTADGEPKLLDFGLAKILAAPDGISFFHSRIPGAIAGTREYLSPEQVLGQPVVFSSDIYSLGVLLYEVLAGQKPYEVRSDAEMVRAIAEDDPPPPSVAASRAGNAAAARELRGDLDNIVMRALRKGKEAHLRYAEVAALRDDLRRYYAGHPLAADTRPLTLGYRTRKLLRRHKSRFALVALFLVAAVVGTAFYLRERSRDEMHRAQLRANNEVLFDSFDRLEYGSGETEARHRLAERILQNLQALETAGRPDSRLEAELAAAYMKMGDSQGRADRASLGDIAAGLKSYERALVWVRRLVDRNPADDVAQGRLAALLLRVGNNQRNLGRTREALATFRDALAIDERLAARHHNDLDRQRNLSVSLDEVGRISAQLGDLPLARRLYEQSNRIAETIAVSRPDDWRSARDIGIGHARLGDIDARIGNWEAAARQYQLSIEARELLALRFPRNAQLQRDVVVGYAKPLDAQIARGQIELARTGACRILAISRALARDAKDGQAQRDLSGAYAFLGQIRAWSGDWAGSVAEHERALEIRQRLAEAAPKDSTIQGFVAYSLSDIARGLAQMGRRDAARQYLEKAVAIREAMVKQDTDNLPARRQLALVYEKLGLIDLDGADLERSRARLAQSLKLQDEVARREAGSRDVREELARIRIGYARALTGDEAQAQSQRALEFYREAATSATASSELLNDYATALLVARPASLKDAKEAVRIAERAVSLTGSKNPAILMTLAAALSQAGDQVRSRQLERRASQLGRDAARISSFCR